MSFLKRAIGFIGVSKKLNTIAYFSRNARPLFHRFEVKIPPADTRPRKICSSCGFINYENPKVVVGVLAVASCSDGDKILLCKRGIEPRKGFWTLPAGFMELHESPESGAAREAKEEACADIQIDRLLAVHSVPKISEVFLWYRGTLQNPESIAAGEESLEVALVDPKTLRKEDIAFPSVEYLIDHYLCDSTNESIDVRTISRMVVEPPAE